MSEHLEELFAQFDETLRTGAGALSGAEPRTDEQRVRAAADRVRHRSVRQVALRNTSEALAACERLRRLGSTSPAAVNRAVVLVVRCRTAGHRLAAVYRLRGRLLLWPEGRVERARFVDDLAGAPVAVGCACGEAAVDRSFVEHHLPETGRRTVDAPVDGSDGTGGYR